MTPSLRAQVALLVLSAWACGSRPSDAPGAASNPVARPDQAVARDGAAVAIDVLANDSAPSGGQLTVTGVGNADRGTTSIVGNRVVYTPDAGQPAGNFTFSYSMSDGSRTASSTVAVRSVLTLDLSGRVHDGTVAGATVTASAGEASTSGVADAAGGYRLVLEVTDPAAVVAVGAAGSAASGQGQVRLATVVGSYQALQHRLGAGHDLAASSEPNLNVTSVTTARYGLLASSSGGLPPAGDAAMLLAEKAIGTAPLLDRAAAIKLAIDDPSRFPLAPGKTTLDLASDGTALAAYLAGVAAVAGGTAALEAARAATLSDPALAPAFPVPLAPVEYHFLYAARAGFLSRGGRTLWLAPAGTGYLADAEQVVALTWAVQNGALLLSFPAPFVSSWLDPIANCPVSLGVQAEYTAQFPSGYIWRTESMATMTLRSLAIGALVTWVQVSATGETVWRPFTVPSGTYSPRAPLDSTYTAELRDSARARMGAFTPALVTGTWAMPVRYEPGSYPSGAAVPAGFYGDLLALSGDGSGSALRSGRALSWAIDASGDLGISFSDGSHQTVRILDSDGTMYGVYVEHRTSPGGSLSASAYDYAFRRDPQLAPAAGLFENGTATYWQTLVNAWQADLWVNEVLDPGQLFGWELHAGGGGIQWRDLDGSGRLERATDGAAITWSVIADAVRLDIPSDGDVSQQYRTWTPLWVAPDGSRLHVFEEAFSRGSPSTPYGLYFTPRLNIYERWPAPR